MTTPKGVPFTGTPAFLTEPRGPPKLYNAPAVREPRPTHVQERPLYAERPMHASRAIHAEPSQPPNLAGLYEFQKAGVRWLHERLAKKKTGLCADEPGCGKSASALRAAPHGMGIIVVCPAGLRINWAREVHKFRRDLSVCVPTVGGAADYLRKEFPKLGVRTYQNGTLPRVGSREVLITSYEGLPEIPEGKNPRWLVPNDLGDVMLIVDEAHYVSNRKADRTRCVRLLRRQCERSLFMTGTPMSGDPLKLYGLLESAGLEREVFGDFGGFWNAFGYKKGKFGSKPAKVPPEDIAAKLAPVMLRRLKKNVLGDLPPKVYTTLVYEVDASLLAEMDVIDAAWLQAGTDKLPPFDKISSVRAKLAEAAIPTMLEVVKRHEDEGVALLVFCDHLAPLEHLGGLSAGGKPREGWGIITGETPGKMRDLYVAKFQAGELRGLALSTRAAGVGLTLTAASHELFVDLSYTPAENQQAEDRAHRIGQVAQSLQITRLEPNHAMGRRMTEILSGKEVRIAATLGEELADGTPDVVKRPRKRKAKEASDGSTG